MLCIKISAIPLAMSKINWHRQHKWSGIVSVILLLSFCLSGIVLNHRNLVSDCEISRKWLPSRYKFQNWNGGLLRGTIPYNDKVLIYGANGIWQTDTMLSLVSDFNNGLQKGADHRQVKGIVKRVEDYYAVTTEALYHLKNDKWEKQSFENDDERLSDITVKGDTLIIVGRSNLYLSTSENEDFNKIELPSSDESDGKVTMFKTVWMLHSGELFGYIGKIIVDGIALILVLLSFTGLILWLLPKTTRYKVRKKLSVTDLTKFLKSNMKIHRKVGAFTIVPALLVAVTGWCLRPPLMIPLALSKVNALPGTTLDSYNPWHDKLRMMRYDDRKDEWLLSTSDGFYRMTEIGGYPYKEEVAPPVSVMGLNVWERDSAGNWICGSFSGMFRWDRDTDIITDYFTGEVSENKSGPPFGKYATAGYSNDFNTVVEYYSGTDDIPQPDQLKLLPMSLWNVALEAHSGRLFIGTIATYIFIFITGLVIIWCLWSGWKVHRRGK